MQSAWRGLLEEGFDKFASLNTTSRRNKLLFDSFITYPAATLIPRRR
jgi:hypothetical protein